MYFNDLTSPDATRQSAALTIWEVPLLLLAMILTCFGRSSAFAALVVTWRDARSNPAWPELEPIVHRLATTVLGHGSFHRWLCTPCLAARSVTHDLMNSSRSFHTDSAGDTHER
jgi:hypothetical protein